MNKFLLMTLCIVLLICCNKKTDSGNTTKKASLANGTYNLNIQYHYSPYNPGGWDTTLKDFDTTYEGSVTVSGFEDTITISTTPADLYGQNSFSGVLVLRSDSNDTLKYKQTYPAPTGAGYGLDEKSFYFDKASHKIYYFIEYKSGHDGYYFYKASQQ